MGVNVGDWLVLVAVAAGALSAWRLLAGLGRGRLLARVGAVVSLSCAAFFGWLWYQQYLKWDFNELGRYYDPVDQVVYTDSGFVWILPAALALAAGLFFAWRGWGGRRA
ncbi:hypothetical protein [Achromobacter xylosoxidans]|uniref:hypothetical protein n=1 Tax=Alcaligenes xylosoxydans xylosoxydans TaxID=85698 RepID=UPI0004F6E46E|nr:hypothetical protein [Achromobacter xylosoxidans]MBK1980418.1 hypothetical protein [Achromobacter xylosoxidans]MCH1988843.1 hypothetical protein [Achromobacter xylosoxidans]MCH4586821.1 hypothetical protein [Achromobacter xylosoxidans]WPQ36362.1 hypothetical protein SLH34_05790 [Achromobacter xylosoxidans]CUK20527.1 Uncharacterised protein [Achromobacter xylosoxidans]